MTVLKLKPLRDTLIASGIVSGACDVYRFIPLLFGAVGSPAGYAVVFLTNAGGLVIGGYRSLRNNAKRAKEAGTTSKRPEA